MQCSRISRRFYEPPLNVETLDAWTAWTVGLTGMLLLVSLPLAATRPANKVTLRTVKYAGLAETIKQKRSITNCGSRPSD